MRTTEYAGGVNLTHVLHHLDTAWRRRHAPQVLMSHYADYTADLPGEIVRLARALDIDTTDHRARELAAEATLDRMRARSSDVIPNAGVIWRDDQAFLRAGGFGEWRAGVNADDLVEYDATVAELVGPDLAAWSHQGRLASGIDPATA